MPLVLPYHSILQPILKSSFRFLGYASNFPFIKKHSFPPGILPYRACKLRCSIIRSVLINAVLLRKAVASTEERFRAALKRDILFDLKTILPFYIILCCIWFDPFYYAFSHLYYFPLSCTIELEKHTTIV